MTYKKNTTEKTILVGIDVAKVKNDVLIEFPGEKRRKMIVRNDMEDYVKFVTYLKSFKLNCLVGLEATGNYHRPIAYFLQSKGFKIKLISSFSLARIREARHNSWDKNDPKDAQVILQMLKAGFTQKFYDPLINNIVDIQELSQTYHQVSLRKTKVQHSILTHYLPLYFPEAQKYFHTTRAEWFSAMLLKFSSPSIVKSYSKKDFIREAWTIAGRKVNKTMILNDFYETALKSIGIPVKQDSDAIKMFQLVLQEHIRLCKMREDIESRAHNYLEDDNDYKTLRTIPGIGPILALTILAEAGDLKRFSHHRQFLKFCGFDLSTQQSGQFRGVSKISKHGNARLRSVFWLAATIAIRMTENSFRNKYQRYIKKDPTNANLKRKAYTATAVKLARVAYSLVKNNTVYRPYFEEAIPSGRICSAQPLRQ